MAFTGYWAYGFKVEVCSCEDADDANKTSYTPNLNGGSCFNSGSLDDSFRAVDCEGTAVVRDSEGNWFGQPEVGR